VSELKKEVKNLEISIQTLKEQNSLKASKQKSNRSDGSSCNGSKGNPSQKSLEAKKKKPEY